MEPSPFGRLIAGARKARRLSLRALAADASRLAGEPLTAAAIHRLEHAPRVRLISPGLLRGLALALDLPMAELLAAAGCADAPAPDPNQPGLPGLADPCSGPADADAGDGPGVGHG